MAKEPEAFLRIGKYPPGCLWPNDWAYSNIAIFFVRKLVRACLRYNIVFKAKHIAGVNNILALRCFVPIAGTGFRANGTSKLVAALNVAEV